MTLKDVELYSKFLIDSEEGEFKGMLGGIQGNIYYFLDYNSKYLYAYNTDRGYPLVKYDGEYYSFDGNIKFIKEDIVSNMKDVI